MITLDDLIKIRPKRITYKNTRYYVAFTKVTKKFNLGDYKSYYFAVLYKESPSYDSLVLVERNKSYEESDISQNYMMEYKHDLEKLIDELKETNKDIEHSPTYIQDIIMYFLEKYIKHKEEEVKYIVEKNEQLSNFEKWDGVISDDK